MENWDDEESELPPVVKPVVPPTAAWDDEDKDDDEVKESWEDDEGEKPAQAQPAPSKTAAVSGTADKTTKKGKEVERKGKTVAKSANEEKLDPIAEKLRQQRLVEESDLRVSKELFKQSGEEERSLDDFVPKSEEEFKEYAGLLAAKLTAFEKSFHYMTMLKTFVRLTTVSLKAADTKDLGSAVAVITNEKVRAEKDTAAKKKVGTKKKQLLVDKADDEDYHRGGYVDNDDFDFM